jgi:F0F1-type ATP synthase membrane subunit b/b'
MTTDNNLFLTTEQEAKRAADELAEIKTQLKEFLAKLTLIEKRLGAIAPSGKAKPAAKKAKGAEQAEAGMHIAEVYEALSEKFKSNDAGVLADLQAMGKDELYPLAKHLGCKATKSSKKEALTELILGRLRESKLLRGGIA